MKDTKDEAIGAYEAACLMGVHFTKPRRMYERGEISARELRASGERSFCVYSRAECDQNFAAYDGAERHGRPRAYLHERDPALKRLADKSRPRIDYGDAIGIGEAAEILGVFQTLVPRLVASGKIVGRILWSERADRSRLWVLSRHSVELRAAEVSRLELAGKKRGRPRTHKA